MKKGEVLEKHFLLDQISELIEKDYLKDCSLELLDNKGQYDSVIIKPAPSPYRTTCNTALFCRLKLNGKSQYMSFNVKYIELFKSLNIDVYQIKSDPAFIRVPLDILNGLDCKKEELSKIFNCIFLDSFSFGKFDCCGRYEQCSDLKKCVHDDPLYSTACTYRKQIENGTVFFGNNRNI